jgi:hypothetical protein
MATLRQFQLALRDKCEQLVQRDDIIDELEAELVAKDAEIDRLRAELAGRHARTSSQPLAVATNGARPTVYVASPSAVPVKVMVDSTPVMYGQWTAPVNPRPVVKRAGVSAEPTMNYASVSPTVRAVKPNK